MSVTADAPADTAPRHELPRPLQAVLPLVRSRWLAVAALFLAAAVIQTWPLAIHMSSRLTAWEIGLPDTWAFLWSIWWVKHALVDLQTNPFHSDLLFYPQGTDLYLHTLVPFIGLLSTPLQIMTGNLVLSWNLLLFVFLVLTGVGTYALAFRVTENHWAALLAGFIFAFSPLLLLKMGGHWNVFSVWPLPFFALFLLKRRQSGSPRDALLAAGFWIILTYINLEYAVWAGFLLGLLVAFWSLESLRQGHREQLNRLWRGAGLTLAAWLALSAPLLAPAFLASQSGEYSLPGGAEYYSADLAAFITPSPLWGPGTALKGDLPTHAAIGGTENTVYLGIFPLLLASLALLSVRRRFRVVLPWALIFAGFALLALGPYLYVGGDKTFSLLGAEFSVPLPYKLYEQIPALNTGRAPARMMVFAMLGLAVLAAIGLDMLTSRLRPRRGPLVPLVGLAALALVSLEFWNPPAYLYEPPAPAGVETIASEDGDFAVLNVPWGRLTGGVWAGDRNGASLASYYQSVHGKRTIGGYVSRAKESDIDWVWEQPGLRYLACATCEEFLTGDDRDPSLVRNVFQEYHIKYVVQMNGGYPGFDDHRQYLLEVVGLTPVFADDDVIVYKDGTSW